MSIYKLKQGEARTLGFIITDEDTNEPMDVSNYTYLMCVKQSPFSVDYAFSVESSAFGTTNANVGRITVFVTSAHTNIEPMDYHGELRIIAPAPTAGSDRAIYKTDYFTLKMGKAITPIS
jgi:hypothetical protein